MSTSIGSLVGGVSTKLDALTPSIDFELIFVDRFEVSISELLEGDTDELGFSAFDTFDLALDFCPDGFWLGLGLESPAGFESHPNKLFCFVASTGLSFEGAMGVRA